MAQQTGRVSVVLDGEIIRSKPGASFQPGGMTRAYDLTDQNTLYFRETFVPAKVSATMVHMSDTDLAKLQKFVGGTLQFKTDTGVVYNVTDAGMVSFGELKDGEISVEFAGQWQA
jgi:hypothetical protein